MHHKIQEVDAVKERLKDVVMKSVQNTFDYIKIVDKNYMVLLDYFERSKERELLPDLPKKIVLDEE